MIVDPFLATLSLAAVLVAASATRRLSRVVKEQCKLLDDQGELIGKWEAEVGRLRRRLADIEGKHASTIAAWVRLADSRKPLSFGEFTGMKDGDEWHVRFTTEEHKGTWYVWAAPEDEDAWILVDVSPRAAHVPVMTQSFLEFLAQEPRNVLDVLERCHTAGRPWTEATGGRVAGYWDDTLEPGATTFGEELAYKVLGQPPKHARN